MKILICCFLILVSFESISRAQSLYPQSAFDIGKEVAAGVAAQERLEKHRQGEHDTLRRMDQAGDDFRNEWLAAKKIFVGKVMPSRKSSAGLLDVRDGFRKGQKGFIDDCPLTVARVVNPTVMILENSDCQIQLIDFPNHGFSSGEKVFIVGRFEVVSVAAAGDRQGATIRLVGSPRPPVK